MGFFDVLGKVLKPASDDPLERAGMRRKPGQAPRPWDERSDPLPDGSSYDPATKRYVNPVKQAADSALGGSTPYPDLPDEHFDWTALVDPRRDEVTPKQNVFEDLPPRYVWLKNEMAKGLENADGVDQYFTGDNVRKTTREIYEGQMGEAAADKAADEAEQSQMQVQQGLAAQLAAGGVHGFQPHPLTGHPVPVDAQGNPVPYEFLTHDAQGNPIDPASATGAGVAPATGPAQPSASHAAPTFNVAGGDGGFIGSGAAPGGQEGGEDPRGALGTVLMHLRQFDDPETQKVMKTIQQHLAAYPGQAKRAELHGPNLLQSLLTLVAAKVLPPQIAMSVLSTPFQAGLHRQQQEQERNDAQHADQVRQWQGGLSLLDNELAAAQKKDLANFDNAVETDKFNATAQNTATKDKLDRDAKTEENKRKEAVVNKRKLQDQVYKIAYGTDSARVDEETRKEAQAIYGGLTGMDESLVSEGDAPYFQQLDQRIRDLTAKAGISESKERVAEATEADQIKFAKERANKMAMDAKVSGKRLDLLGKQLWWYDEKAAAGIAKDHAIVANTADMIRSRGVRDKLALTKDERTGVNQALTRGQIELNRLRLENKTDREDLAKWDAELNGEVANGRRVGGLREQLAKEEAKKTGKNQAAIDSIKTRIKEIERQSDPDVEGSAANRVRERGKLYEETAKDVIDLRKASTVKALGDKDDRKVDIGPYTFDLAGKYVFGAKGEESKDCSGFVQAAMKTGGVKNFPGSCKTQIDWMQSASGRKAGFQDVTKTVASGREPLQEGDILYLPGAKPPKGSGYHVKVFAGWGEDGKPVWMEAKGRTSGVGTFKDDLKGKSLYGIFRPPQKGTPPQPTPEPED